MKEEAPLVNALKGALQAGGAICGIQCLLSMRLRAPNSLAISSAALIGIFRLIDSYERQYFGKENSPRAAFISALVAIILIEKKRTSTLASYALVEALHDICKEYSPIHRNQTANIAITVGTFVSLIYGWIYHAEHIVRSQLSSLDYFSCLSNETLKNLRLKVGRCIPNISRCEVIHPSQTCLHFHIQLTKRICPSSMKVFIPIYLFSAVLTKYKRWIYGPRPPIVPLIKRYLGSTLCLMLMYQIPLAISCTFPVKESRLAILQGGACSSLSLLVEQDPSRRMSLIKAMGAYVLCMYGNRLSHVLRLPKASKNWICYLAFACSMTLMLQRKTFKSQQFLKLLHGYDPSKVKIATTAIEVEKK